jgi:hypothetical protein
MITIDPENVETIESSFWERIEPGKYTHRQGATAADIESGARWYPDKEPMIQELAEIGDTTIEVVGTVTSAFSIRERWPSNVEKVYDFFNGIEVRGLEYNLHAANMATVLGFDALNGPKTSAFARALTGDDQAIVIDVWMMRAAGFTKDSPNKTDYAEISEAIRNVSNEMGLSPRTTQALIWILVRGSGE